MSSLTRAAAAEVAGRKTSIPRQNIGTLHAHAYHALKRPAIVETAEGLKEWNEYCGAQRYRVDPSSAVDPENAQAEGPILDNEGAEMLNRMNILRSRRTPVELWPPKIQRFAKKWEEFKAETNRMDFTDLIVRALEDIDEHPRKPDVMMVDEAQDMSILEMGLAKKWGERARQLVIVGDPDQNLYQWRGSDPAAFYDGLATTERVLSQSYRVPEAVHAWAVQWIEQMEGRPRIEYQPRREDPTDPESPYVEGSLERASVYWGEPGKFANELERALERTVVEYDPATGTAHERPATVMVLTSCAYMLKPLVAELRARGLPFHNPYRVINGAWNPLSRGSRRLLAFLKAGPTERGGDGQMWTWRDLKAWIEPLQARGVLENGVKSLIEARNIEDRFGDTAKADVPVGIDELLRLFTTDEHRSAVFDVDTEWWERHLLHKYRDQQKYPLTVARRRGTHVLKETPRLIVGTIHSVKGGEADIVFMCPDLSPVAYFNGWKTKGDGHNAILRQFYVGATRARHELVLCKSTSREYVKW